jgi:surface antigen
MQERWITGVAVLALTLIPAAALASAPNNDATKRETPRVAHPAPAHHTSPVHETAKAEPHRAPERHIVAKAEPRNEAVHHEVAHNEVAHQETGRREPEHAPMRRIVAYHPKYEHSQLKAQKAVYYSHWESCVPFARATSGIMLKGNAAYWWSAAAGVYARGQDPEPGSVLNFRATGRMRLGHVSVVTRVINSREIMVDHANWWGPGANKNGISRNVPVIDVSPVNDWTEVRVGLGSPGSFGSVYPTYGFIYDRPDNGVILANARGAAPAQAAVEVAEAPDAAPIASQPLHHSLLDFSSSR